MNTKFLAGLAAALLLAGPAFAHDRGGGGGGRSFSAFTGGGTRGFASSRDIGGSFRSPSVAFGGSANNSRAYGGGGARYAYAFRSHSGWNRGNEYAWNGHHYRWYNGGWYIIDPFADYAYYPYYDYYGPAYTVYGQADDANAPAANASAANAPVPVQVQTELARQGYYRGPIDGIVGPMTSAAIAAYQRDNGLRITGTINGHLLDALDLD